MHRKASQLLGGSRSVCNSSRERNNPLTNGNFPIPAHVATSCTSSAQQNENSTKNNSRTRRFPSVPEEGSNYLKRIFRRKSIKNPLENIARRLLWEAGDSRRFKSACSRIEILIEQGIETCRRRRTFRLNFIGHSPATCPSCNSVAPPPEFREDQRDRGPIAFTILPTLLTGERACTWKPAVSKSRGYLPAGSAFRTPTSRSRGNHKNSTSLSFLSPSTTANLRFIRFHLSPVSSPMPFFTHMIHLALSIRRWNCRISFAKYSLLLL